MTHLEAGAGASDLMLDGPAFHLRGDAGEASYFGAAPPVGDRPHRYVFTVHALDTDSLGLDDDATPAMASFVALEHTLRIMLHIIFWEPEIPGNTGAAIRLSACTGSMLHLVKPLGFDMDDAKLRRAGLDYHDLAHVRVHDSLDEALAEVPGRVWALTGHATTMYSDVSYADGDGLLFGRESVGLSEDAMHHPRVEDRVRIQMVNGVRSLNLANSASIVLYEAWRQLGFPNGV
ncbi:tRNA/rRNA methyltransferase SpoU [Mycobacteroides abscessus subsp. abscessus]|nr:tRNA/rRNA methyltransferase SpoU [Mycobacteroides abscessus subsp. abscessus]